MPRMDGTGPTGQGPATGRRLGPCSTYGTTAPRKIVAAGGWMSLLSGVLGGLGMGRRGGRGLGCGRGQGRGRRQGF
jgi:hypothetical protein